ncbi:MAG: DUF2892 domain-containing protein [Gammaproteobacteria bacterium]|nr:DUF2892 domain-containing protein [Gammaproteobacteria bacterium]
MNATGTTYDTTSSINVGSLDRIARLGLGALLIGIELSAGEPRGVNVVMTLVAIPLIITALIAWDPIYALLGKRTATLRAQPMDLRTYHYRDANAGINMGWPDRFGRLGFGAALLSVTLLGSGPVEWGVFTALVSIPIIMTGMLGFDPIYQMVGIRSAFLPQSPKPGSAAGYNQPVQIFTFFDEVQSDSAGKRAA